MRRITAMAPEGVEAMRLSARKVLFQAVGGSLTMALLLMGCASMQHPVLYPNAYLQQVGQQEAERDIAACREMADAYVQRRAGRDVARNTAVGGAGGAAIGAVGGAVSGGGAGRGAAIGAATGATAGALSGLAKQTTPSPVYKNFVDRCLRERGYEVIGWQ
jgi:outer membrane lipoprotein SlyB